ncbi:MAG: hypothetical protein RSE41_00475 [Clostridia bacterium]
MINSIRDIITLEIASIVNFHEGFYVILDNDKDLCLRTKDPNTSNIAEVKICYISYKNDKLYFISDENETYGIEKIPTDLLFSIYELISRQI